MKKLALFISCTLTIWLDGQVSAQQTGLSSAASKALPAVVRVQSFVSDSMYAIHAAQATRIGIRSLGSAGSTLAGSASGVLVSPDGYIITNAHILNGGDSLAVILPDRSAYRAVLTGIDEEADLALLKIPANGLIFLELGNPDLVKIGEPVLAVGNPLDLTSTATAGILSARFRALDDAATPTQINSYLQTDAASNEGMSGSALVDQSGKLIGINSAIVSPSGAFAGYAFAIPAGLVKKAWHDLLAYGAVQHAYLDVSFSDMDAVQAKRLGTKNLTGVLINRVQTGGAGQRAGLRRDDIITGFDQHRIIAATQLRELLGQCTPGDSAKLIILRGSIEMPLSVALSASSVLQAENWRGDRPAKRTNGVH
jgi:S1-C subfamily serine protease